MPSEAEINLTKLAIMLIHRADELESAQYFHKVVKVAYIKESLASGRSFAVLAKDLECDESAVRRFWARHNKEVGPRDYDRVRERFNIRFNPPGGAG